jgi:nicotinamide riboside transporter PnuC
MGKKRNVKKGKKWNWPFAFSLHLFCFLDLLSRFAFNLLLFCFFLLFAWEKQKKQNKSKQKANLESSINAKKCKWTSPCFSYFFPFLTFLFSPFFVPSILLLCFLDFADLLFGCSFVLLLSHFFQVLIKLE